MRTRVKAGAEEDGEDVKWRAIANVKQDKWGEREEEHRAWIIAELEKRVDRQFSGECNSHIMKMGVIEHL